MIKFASVLCCAAVLTAGALSARAEGIMGGRPVDPKKDFSLTLQVGQVTEIKGSVDETTRRVYDLLGLPEKQLDAESYDLNELGLTESEIIYGLNLEKRWRYITLRGDFAYLNAEASEVAKRDYFIGVDDISFNGRNYEYMKLEDGEAYKATMDGAMIALRSQITPFTLAPENILSFTPFIHLGLQVIAGTFEVEAGPAERIQLYENPPREYVVGGTGEGDFGVFAPELGAGGELRLYLGQTQNGPIELAVQGTYAIFEYTGSSDSLGISSRNDKDLDIEYDMIELQAEFNYPLSTEVDLLLGAKYQVITADATSKAKITSREEALTTREKFDKDINLELTTVTFFAGFRF